LPAAAIEQIEAADDWGKEIVEVLRDAAHELAHRLQFLPLAHFGERVVPTRAAITSWLIGVVTVRSSASWPVVFCVGWDFGRPPATRLCQSRHCRER
jgi:hypothetical protein